MGLFYPAYGVIKSEKIPEDIRSAVMNIFRIPLNAFVVLLLLKIKFLSSQVVFFICTMAHLVALLCYAYFYAYSGKGATPSAAGNGIASEKEKLLSYGRQSSELELHQRESGGGSKDETV